MSSLRTHPPLLPCPCLAADRSPDVDIYLRSTMIVARIGAHRTHCHHVEPRGGPTNNHHHTTRLRRTQMMMQLQSGAATVVAKVEFHAGELFPRVGFIVTNLETPSRAVVRFYNKRGTAEQWIKEGKQAVKMTRLSCHRTARTKCGWR